MIRRILIGIAVAALLAVGGFLFLAPGKDTDDGFEKSKVVELNVWAVQKQPKKGAPFYDGIVRRDANAGFLPLRLRGGGHVDLYVRPDDQPFIDVQHAQSHADLGQPVRAYWRKDGSKKYVIYLMDTPVL